MGSERQLASSLSLCGRRQGVCTRSSGRETKWQGDLRWTLASHGLAGPIKVPARSTGRGDHLPPQLVNSCQKHLAVRKGGTVVCGGIHMSDIPRMPYKLLWSERQVVSIANLARGRPRVLRPSRAKPTSALSRPLTSLKMPMKR